MSIDCCLTLHYLSKDRERICRYSLLTSLLLLAINRFLTVNLICLLHSEWFKRFDGNVFGIQLNK
jgi:hypothetical protein